MAQEINRTPEFSPQRDASGALVSQKNLQNFERLKKEEEDCIAKGGKWNSATKTCTLPDTSGGQDTALPGSIVTNAETGEAAGFINSKGQFVKAGKEDIAKQNQMRAEDAALLQGQITTEQIGQSQARQEQIQRLLNAAQQGLLTTEELQAIGGADVNWSEALGAGAAGVLPGLAAGAASGAIAGSVVPGIGTAIGAAGGALIGGIGTFLNSMKSNIKGQQTGEFTADREALTKGERYLRSLITDTNQNPQNAPENIALFYNTLNLIDAAHAKTWKDSQENLNIFLGNDGTPQLAKFDVFDTTMRNYYVSQFSTALNSPNPTRVLITAEDLGVDVE